MSKQIVNTEQFAHAATAVAVKLQLMPKLITRIVDTINESQFEAELRLIGTDETPMWSITYKPVLGPPRRMYNQFNETLWFRDLDAAVTFLTMKLAVDSIENSAQTYSDTYEHIVKWHITKN